MYVCDGVFESHLTTWHRRGWVWLRWAEISIGVGLCQQRLGSTGRRPPWTTPVEGYCERFELRDWGGDELRWGGFGILPAPHTPRGEIFAFWPTHQ